jgi:hypothetical protein
LDVVEKLRVAVASRSEGGASPWEADDDKSSGFDWDHSRVREPAHMERLLLVLQLAVGFVLAQGTFVLQHGFRSRLERADRRTLSVFSLGLRWFAYARAHFLHLSPHLRLTFPEPRKGVG